jgi:hypothetical protein
LKNSANAALHTYSNGGYLARKIAAQRHKLINAFLEFKGSAGSETILDVGAASSAFLEKGSDLQASIDGAERSSITRCNVAVSPDKPWRITGSENGQLSGQILPYRDGQFDWVFCGELIEHAGTNEHQLNLLRELARVAKKGVFVTTENKRHPIEFNTGLPLLHWLPDTLWRAQLRLLGKGEWASKWLLNPLGSDSLRQMAAQLPKCASSDIGHMRLGGVKAHFFLMIRKAETI